MSDERPRRYHAPQEPETPTGYRQSRRGSKSAKAAKRAQRSYHVASVLDRTWKGFRAGVYVIAYAAVVLGLSLAGILLIITTINTVARWSAQHRAASAETSATASTVADENLLVIATDGDQAAGFLALRVDEKGEQVYGIGIPEGAFIDVPGQGFERVAEAYSAGPDVALSAVSNYLTVPFERYLVVPKEVYTDAMTEQSVSGLPAAATQTNLSSTEIEQLTAQLEAIPEKNVALVPMPVKQLKLGDQTYFEPQREEIADLLESWWGVDATQQAEAIRVIVYNGAGIPGIAGEAAQVLIRSGFRVVDTKNADNFDYDTTRIVVRRGDISQGTKVYNALGVGEVSSEPSDAEVADVIVIIGKDYTPPEGDDKEGSQ